MYKKSLFVFRRDLRLDDNTGLIQSLAASDSMIPIFIYDDIILKKSEDSEFRLNFLNESLLELDYCLKKKNSFLQIFCGLPYIVIEKILSENNIDAVFVNTDFTAYSKNRDEKINQICQKNNVAFHSVVDFLLYNPNEIKTNDEKPYTVYSHFYKKAKQFPVRKISKNPKDRYSKEKISTLSITSPTIKNPEIKGGRSMGLKILKDLEKFRYYRNFRDFPALNPTTTLSAHNKFGTLSIREVYHTIREKLGADHMLMREIHWREFFSYILFHFPWTQKNHLD